MAFTLLRLVRWPNLLMLVGIFLVIRYGLIDAFNATTLLRSCLTDVHWFLMTVTTVLLAASGNLLNDILDQDVDSHNKPNSRIVGVSISEEQAWNLYYGLSGTGLALGLLLNYLLGHLSNGLIFLLALGGLWFYSYSYKRQFLIGNLVVAFFAGAAVFLPLLLEMICNPNGWMQLPWMPFIVFYALFSLVSTLVRELVKDMEDMQGDGRFKCYTVPVVLGVTATKVMVFALTLLIMTAIGRYQWAKWESNDMLSSFYLLIAVQVPAAVMLRKLISASNPKGFHDVSSWAKLMMVGGISSMLLFRWILS